MKQNPCISNQIVFAARALFVRPSTDEEKLQCSKDVNQQSYTLTDQDGHLAIFVSGGHESAFLAAKERNLAPQWAH